MMKTTIEITGETCWQFEENTKQVLAVLGYEPKRDAEQGAFHADLASAMYEAGLDPQAMVQEFRTKKFAKAA